MVTWQNAYLIFNVGFMSCIALALVEEAMRSTVIDSRDSAAPTSDVASVVDTSHLDEFVEVQIENIHGFDIPELVQKMPSNSWYKRAFTLEGMQWRFLFECNFVDGRFYATATGKTPREAFVVARTSLEQQIEEWRRTRFNEEAPQPLELVPPAPIENKRVLVIDDDVDLALAMQAALTTAGYHVDIATQHEDLHRKIIFSNVDYILMDWQLNNKVTADTVVQKAIRLIDTFSDLREKFTAHKPRVVTYSVLNRDEITLPPTGDRYFSHVDHWQKPMPFCEVVERAAELLPVH